MKTTILVACLFVAASAFGQTAGYLTGPTVTGSTVQMYDHPMAAAHHDMGEQKSLLSGSQYTYAQGERPLWEFALPDESKPLGDVARELKKEHNIARKSTFVYVN